MEVPEILTKDIREFVQKVETLASKHLVKIKHFTATEVP